MRWPQSISKWCHRTDDFWVNCLQVVLAAVRVYHRLAPASWANRYIGPLLRLLQAQPEVQAVVLANIAVIAASRPVSPTREHI